MRWTILLLLCLTLASCDPSKRLTRFCWNHPEMCARDTVRDTVWAEVEYVRADTVFLPTPRDTVRVSEGRLRIKYVLMPGDTVWLEGECLADSVPVYVELPCPPRVNPVKYVKAIPWWGWAIVIASMAIALLSLLRRRS